MNHAVQEPSGRRDQMRFAVFTWGDSNYHNGGWRHPNAVTDAGANFRPWIRFARAIEAAKIDLLFVGDNPGVPWFDNKVALARSNKAERFEPFTLLAALSGVTERLGLVGTGTTTFHEPFNLARTVASLDLLSGGRAGWNVVTGGDQQDVKHYGRDKHVPSQERYARAEEFVDVTLALWDSVERDAFLRDKASGRWVDPEKLHAINHAGSFYAVKGPLSVAPSPQGRPILVQAGQSEEGRALGARIADVIFTSTFSLEVGQAYYADMKRRAAGFGRRPEDLKVLPGVAITVGRTEAEAEEKDRYLDSLLDLDVALEQLRTYLGGADLSGYALDEPAPRFGANTVRAGGPPVLNAISQAGNLTLRQLALRVAATRNHLAVKGTPSQVADVLETWFRSGAADGFNILPNMVPDSITDFADLVVPELQRRGLFRCEYEGRTLRENLGLAPIEPGWSRRLRA